MDGDEAEDGDEGDGGGEEVGGDEPDAEELVDGDVEGEVWGVVGCGPTLSGQPIGLDENLAVYKLSLTESSSSPPPFPPSPPPQEKRKGKKRKEKQR